MATTQELIDRLRGEILGDTEGVDEGDSLWTDPNLINSLTWAERELCRSPLYLISGDTTSALCTIPVVADAGVYPRTFNRSPLILKVESLHYTGITRPLAQVTRHQLDTLDSRWKVAVGTPTHYVVDQGAITLNRIPDAAATLSLTLTRLPLVALTHNGSPEIQGFDELLLAGAASRAYLKQDSQTLDNNASNRWAKEFKDGIAAYQRDQVALRGSNPVMRSDFW